MSTEISQQLDGEEAEETLLRLLNKHYFLYKQWVRPALPNILVAFQQK